MSKTMVCSFRIRHLPATLAGLRLVALCGALTFLSLGCGGGNDDWEGVDPAKGTVSITVQGTTHHHARGQMAYQTLDFTELFANENNSGRGIRIHFPFRSIMEADESLWEQIHQVDGLSNPNGFMIWYGKHVTHPSLKELGATLAIKLDRWGYEAGDMISGTFSATLFEAQDDDSLGVWEPVDGIPLPVTGEFQLPITTGDPLLGEHDLIADYTTAFGSVTGERTVVQVIPNQYAYQAIQPGVTVEKVHHPYFDLSGALLGSGGSQRASCHVDSAVQGRAVTCTITGSVVADDGSGNLVEQPILSGQATLVRRQESR